MEEEKSGNHRALLYLSACLIVVLSVISVMLYDKSLRLEQQQQKNADLVELQNYVEKNFYQPVDVETVENAAMKGYVAGLNDPYSSYLTADEFGQWQEKEAGASVGIGITVQYLEKEGGLLVIGVTENSPALVAGLKTDDVITAIDGEQVSELTFEEAVSKVKGEVDTIVTLTIRRDGEVKELEVKRQEIITITATGTMLENNVGYVRIAAFRENTVEQYRQVMESLLKQGAAAFVFDLRDNGGGLLNALEQIIDPLLPEGNIAVANFGNGDVKTIVASDARDMDLPMAVLVNGNTASAAELFAASLKDFDKGFLVGEQTYGKGIMQDTQSVGGGAVTLTVATYQTVRGECYQGVGLTPDYVVAPAEGFTVDFNQPDPVSDVQLKTALEHLSDKSTAK